MLAPGLDKDRSGASAQKVKIVVLVESCEQASRERAGFSDGLLACCSSVCPLQARAGRNQVIALPIPDQGSVVRRRPVSWSISRLTYWRRAEEGLFSCSVRCLLAKLSLSPGRLRTYHCSYSGIAMTLAQVRYQQLGAQLAQHMWEGSSITLRRFRHFYGL